MVSYFVFYFQVYNYVLFRRYDWAQYIVLPAGFKYMSCEVINYLQQIASFFCWVVELVA